MGNSIERDKTNIARSISTNTNINNCACEDVNDKNNNCYNNISGSESDTSNINIKIKQQEQQTEKEAVILRLKKVVEMENDKRYNQKYRRIKQQQSFLSLKHMFLPITMLRFPRKEEEVTKRNESENSNDAMKEMSKKGDKIQTAHTYKDDFRLNEERKENSSAEVCTKISRKNTSSNLYFIKN